MTFPKAEAAFPEGCIRISEAFNRYYAVWRSLIAHPAKDSLVFILGNMGNAEIEFRAAMDRCELQPKIHNSQTGEVMNVAPPEGANWSSTLPFWKFGISDDYFFPGDLAFPGPDTSLGDGQARMIFFRAAEFEDWLGRIRDELVPDDSAPAAVPIELASDVAETTSEERWPIPAQQPNTREQAQVWLVARRVWGAEGGPPRTMSVRQIKDRLNEAREGTKADGGFSDSTVRRALALY